MMPHRGIEDSAPATRNALNNHGRVLSGTHPGDTRGEGGNAVPGAGDGAVFD